MANESDAKEVIITQNEADLSSMVPTMNVSLPQKTNESDNLPNLIPDQMLIGIYDEILKEIRSDREQIDEVLQNFVNLVINEGDSSSASKEALVNLIKAKSDQADKMTKVADLMTRIKMKDKDTFPRYLAANQTNNINVGPSPKRAILDAVKRAKKLGAKNEE